MDLGLDEVIICFVDKAIIFVTRVRQRLVNEPQVYTNFLLDIIHLYKQGRLDPDEVQEQMFAVLTGHPDLLQEFTHFLPPAVHAVAQDEVVIRIVDEAIILLHLRPQKISLFVRVKFSYMLS